MPQTGDRLYRLDLQRRVIEPPLRVPDDAIDDTRPNLALAGEAVGDGFEESIAATDVDGVSSGKNSSEFVVSQFQQLHSMVLPSHVGEPFAVLASASYARGRFFSGRGRLLPRQT